MRKILKIKGEIIMLTIVQTAYLQGALIGGIIGMCTTLIVVLGKNLMEQKKRQNN